MRYFLHLAYQGTHYVGWQNQPNGVSVQSCLEKVLENIFNREIHIVGCGRTDAGVHASQFYAHFDGIGLTPSNLGMRLNALLPDDIVVYEIYLTDSEAHARFDALDRTYRYDIARQKSPFKIHQQFVFLQYPKIQFDLLQATANLFLNYREFSPFCKSKSDTKTKYCKLSASQWESLDGGSRLRFRVKSNRFLRGMVRLMVGACLNVAIGKITLESIKESLDQQFPTPKPWSVPAKGLFLEQVTYPHQFFKQRIF